MGKGVLYSGLLHLAVFLVLVIGLPSFVSTPDVAPPIPVELVSLDQDLPKPKPKKVEPPPEPEPEPEPEEEVVEPPPPAPAVAEPAPPAPEPEPETDVAEPLPEPEPEAIPEPEPEPEKTEDELPEPKRKPQVKVAMPESPKEPEPEAPKDRLTSILQNVDKLKQQAAKPAPSDEAKAAAPQQQASAIEVNEIARIIQNKMARCWRLEPGARNAEDLVVVVHVLLNPDGSVRRAEIVDDGRFNKNSFYRSAAENARRAIYKCQPFDLPPKRYEIWRDIVLHFDPRQMFGG